MIKRLNNFFKVKFNPIFLQILSRLGFYNFTKISLRKINISFLILFIVCFLIGFRNILVKQTLVFCGDAELWYAFFHYFTESIYNNILALWNPYMHGGESFYMNWNLWRLLDPLNVIFVFIGKAFNITIFRLYHIQFIFKILLASLGIYFLYCYIFSPYKRNKLSYYLITIFVFVLFTALFVTCFLSDGHYVTLAWTPYILLFWMRFLDKKNIRDFLFTIYFLGIHVGAAGYNFIYGSFFLFIFTVITFILEGIVKEKYVRVFTRILSVNSNKKKYWRKLGKFVRQYPIHIIIAILCFLIMCTPMLTTFIESKNAYPVARTQHSRDIFTKDIENVFDLNFKDVANGGSLNLTTITKTFTNMINAILHRTPSIKTIMITGVGLSYVFVGLFFLGLALGRNKWKVHFFIMFIFSIFIIAGNYTPVYEILSFIFFPLNYVRNTFFVLTFSFFFYFYFVGLGLFFLNNLAKSRHIRYFYNIILMLMISIVLFFFISGKFYIGEKIDKMIPNFNHKAQKFVFIKKRKFAIPRTGWYFMDPILYKEDAALTMLGPPFQDKDSSIMPYYKEWHKIWETSGRVPGRHPPCYGLRTIFWTKYYYQIYRAGEADIDIFNALMGIDEDVIDFKKSAIIMNDNQLQKLLVTIPSSQVKNFLKETVIVANNDFSSTLKDVIKTDLNEQANITVPSKKLFTYEMVSYNPSNIKMNVTNETNGMLLFRDGYDKNWHCYIDKKKSPIFRANIGFKAIKLIKGKHEVEFKYRPIFVIISIYSFIGLSFIAPFLIFIFGKNRSGSSI